MTTTNKKALKIAIIDSGIDLNRKELNYDKIICLNDCNDKIGHGTAVASIIQKQVPNATLYIYNLFSNMGRVDSVELANVLNQIHSCQQFDIIHLSCGIVSSDSIDVLHNVIKKIFYTGTIFVSAFDNEGSVSYPAAFEEVIGVDWNALCPSGIKYIYMKDSLVNILGTGSIQRLPWLNGTYKYVAGSSFAAPYITSIVAKCLENGINKFSDILNYLEKNAYQVLNVQNSKYIEKSNLFKIKKAIIFPFNKELHSLAVNQDSLSFSIQGIYEPSLFRNVGKKVSEILSFCNSSITISDIKKLDWSSDFDTVILGHTKLIANSLNNDMILEILEQCIRFKKNIYSFDSLDFYKKQVELLKKEGCWAFHPKIDESDVDNSLLGKLYKISTPVIGFFGTSPKQGKFTLQIAVKNMMSKLGYKIGGLATEPSAQLFNFDFSYPLGYECSVHISGVKSIQTLNRLMHEIDKKNYDLIIVGSQSQTVPYNTGNVGHYPIYQQDFLLGTEPDAVILCINPFDEIHYISRTIKYLENYIDTKVIALSLFPKNKVFEWSIQGAQTEDVPIKTLSEIKNYYSNVFQIPCFLLGDERDLEKMINHIIDFFS